MDGLKRRRRLYAAVALVLGAALVPVGAMAADYGEGGKGAAGGQRMAPAGEHRPMPAPAHHGMAGDHQMAGDHHMAPEAAHADRMVPKHEKPRSRGVVEGGFGSSANSGGSVVGDDTTPAGHWDGGNQGGSIH